MNGIMFMTLCFTKPEKLRQAMARMAQKCPVSKRGKDHEAEDAWAWRAFIQGEA
jgi:hypothetical protein